MQLLGLNLSRNYKLALLEERLVGWMFFLWHKVHRGHIEPDKLELLKKLKKKQDLDGVPIQFKSK